MVIINNYNTSTWVSWKEEHSLPSYELSIKKLVIFATFARIIKPRPFKLNQLAEVFVTYKYPFDKEQDPLRA
jgi:hypothetical protein